MITATAIRAAVAAGSLTPDDRAGLPGTASRRGPAGQQPLARLSPLARRTTSRRWSAGRPPATAAAGRIVRKWLPPVGRRRPARVETVLCADAARSRRSRSQCSHALAASEAVELSRRCLLRVTASCGHRLVSDCSSDPAWFVTRRSVLAAAAGSV